LELGVVMTVGDTIVGGLKKELNRLF
jgi:hypothetical protein